MFDLKINPHAILGIHTDGPRKVIRLFRPGAEVVFLEVKGEIVQAARIHEAGFFEYTVPLDTTFADYRIYHQNGLLAHDPYAFLP